METIQTAEFQYDANSFEVSKAMLAAFDRHGYVIMRSLLDLEEVDRILQGVNANKEFITNSWGVADDKGGLAKLVIWRRPGNDVTGMVARCHKVAGTCEKLLGGEVFHYGSKLMLKNAETGGRHVWHQDYGYWYGNGCLRPDMMTVFIAIDPCTKQNGCLQLLPGTHLCGRIDHALIGGQQGCDLKRLEMIRQHYPHVYAEMKPGDALFFHSNLLHASSENSSQARRWALLTSYNRADNDAVLLTAAPNYAPLEMVPNESIKLCDNLTDLSGKEFYDPDKDPMVKASK